MVIFAYTSSWNIVFGVYGPDYQKSREDFENLVTTFYLEAERDWLCD